MAAKKPAAKTPDAYAVTVDGEPVRLYHDEDSAYAYVGRRVLPGGDLPVFEVVPVERVQ